MPGFPKWLNLAPKISVAYVALAAIGLEAVSRWILDQQPIGREGAGVILTCSLNFEDLRYTARHGSIRLVSRRHIMRALLRLH
jgi:hypothetical protein